MLKGIFLKEFRYNEPSVIVDTLWSLKTVHFSGIQLYIVTEL